MDDRTSEFQALARSLPGADLRRPSPGSTTIPTPPTSTSSTTTAATSTAATTPSHENKGAAAKNNPAYAELRSFQLTAGGISKDIAGTSALLTELTHLVRHQSLLSDENEQARINQLVRRIKTNIENLNARLDHAAHVIAQQKRRLGQNSQAGQQAANLVDGLRSEFAQAASGFKKVLQQRTDTLRETDQLQKQVYNHSSGSGMGGGNDDDDDNPIPNMSLAPLPVYNNDPYSYNQNQQSQQSQQPAGAFPTLDLTSGMMSAGEATGSLPRPHGLSSSYGGGGGATGATPYHSAHTSFLEDEQQQQQAMTPLDIQRMEQESGLQMELIPNQEFYQNRAEAMSQVEAGIVELGTIFNKLADVVAEHREMVQRVEDNVDEANTNIGLSMNVLTDTLTSLRSNKTLALRVFSVLVLFIIAFIVFFA